MALTADKGHIHGLLPVVAALLAAPALLGTSGCSERAPSGFDTEPQKLAGTTMQVAGKSITVEVARTKAEMAKGLMFRDSMPMDHGMLFVYPKKQKMSFFMLNCRFPLDVAFIRADGTIDQIGRMEPREELPTRSKSEVRFVLEMNGGWFEKNGIEPGDKVVVPE